MLHLCAKKWVTGWTAATIADAAAPPVPSPLGAERHAHRAGQVEPAAARPENGDVRNTFHGVRGGSRTSSTKPKAAAAVSARYRGRAAVRMGVVKAQGAAV